MKRAFALGVVAVSASLLILGTASTATADHEFYTNGTTYTSDIDYGPPPGVSIDLETCEALVDPPHYVWITFHHIVDGQSGHDVKPYERDETGWLRFDIPSEGECCLDDGWFTWNIGTGESEHISAECETETTTTTIVDEPTTTTTVPATTTTTNATTTTDSPTTTTTVASPTTTAGIVELPHTGTNGLMGIGAIVLLAIGSGIMWAARPKKNQLRS